MSSSAFALRKQPTDIWKSYQASCARFDRFVSQFSNPSNKPRLPAPSAEGISKPSFDSVRRSNPSKFDDLEEDLRMNYTWVQKIAQQILVTGVDNVDTFTLYCVLCQSVSEPAQRLAFTELMRIKEGVELLVEMAESDKSFPFSVEPEYNLVIPKFALDAITGIRERGKS